jgi:rhodanese-related sulfurtransferase
MNATTNELQKMWFRAKLAAEKQKMEVIKKVQEGQGDFVLLDSRDAKSFEKGHIPGALSFPLDELEKRVGELERGREYVTYCWNAT